MSLIESDQVELGQKQSRRVKNRPNGRGRVKRRTESKERITPIEFLHLGQHGRAYSYACQAVAVGPEKSTMTMRWGWALIMVVARVLVTVLFLVLKPKLVRSVWKDMKDMNTTSPDDFCLKWAVDYKLWFENLSV